MIPETEKFEVYNREKFSALNQTENFKPLMNKTATKTEKNRFLAYNYKSIPFQTQTENFF